MRSLVLCFFLGVASAALANKGVTYLTNTTSSVTSLSFTPQPTGAWSAVVCGQTKDAVGNSTVDRCYKRVFANGSGPANTLTTFTSGQALPFWQASFDAEPQ